MDRLLCTCKMVLSFGRVRLDFGDDGMLIASCVFVCDSPHSFVQTGGKCGTPVEPALDSTGFL